MYGHCSRPKRERNFMLQFRDLHSRDLLNLTSTQFLDIWQHYDNDGKCPTCVEIVRGIFCCPKNLVTKIFSSFHNKFCRIPDDLMSQISFVCLCCLIFCSLDYKTFIFIIIFVSNCFPFVNEFWRRKENDSLRESLLMSKRFEEENEPESLRSEKEWEWESISVSAFLAFVQLN